MSAPASKILGFTSRRQSVDELLSDVEGEALCIQYMFARFVNGNERGAKMFQAACGLALDDYIEIAKSESVRKRCVEFQRAKYGVSYIEEAGL